jgi:hypothetical protein
VDRRKITVRGLYTAASDRAAHRSLAFHWSSMMASDVARVAPTTVFPQRPNLPAIELRALMLRRPLLTWSRFGRMLVAMATLVVLACVTRNRWIDWPCYLALGYLWMGLVTFMHDALALKAAAWTSL